MAEIDTLLNPRVPDDHGIAVFRYSDGLMAEVTSSFTCVAGENTTEIICEKGSIIQNYGDGPSCNIPRPEGGVGLKWFLKEKGEWTYSDLPTPSQHGHRIAGLARHFADFVRGEAGPVATAAEGRLSLKMLLACYVSSREGRRVALHDPAIACV